MCIAEALLRIPDAATADRLIRDKLSRGDWEKHLGGDSMLVNASTWALMLTGRLVRLGDTEAKDPAAGYERLVARLGEPVVRVALRRAMKLMADEFVMGRTIGEALARGRKPPHPNARHSFDMLGEAAYTAADARRYADAYAGAIDAIGASVADRDAPAWVQPSISVKLSALHPRFEFVQAERVLRELLPVVASLAAQARAHGIGFTVDAEEADRLELSLDVFARLRRDPALGGWNGFGLAVQAYQKRARPVVDWVVALARATRTRIPVRLVKGAYWDTEVKRAQMLGLADYPVFTRKVHTDVSYLACAKALLDAGDAVYPMFASHNAHTVAWVAARAHERGTTAFEFQRLHGMGESLYAQVCAPPHGHACRIYAPVGTHEDLLPYLVRRLLENGANTSFVHRIADPSVSIADIVADPVDVGAAAPLPAQRADAAPARSLRRSPELGRRHARRPGCDGAPRRGARRRRGAALARRADRRRDARRRRGARRRRSLRHDAHDRHDHRRRRGDRRPRARGARESAAGVGRARRRGARRDPRRDRRRVRAPPGRVRRAARARSRQDAARVGRRGARGGRLLPLLRGAGARPVRRAVGAALAHRRDQRAVAARARRLRVHLAVELPARDLHRPDRGRARPRATRSPRSRPSRRRFAPRSPSRRCSRPACRAT
jgi:RHH-type proline utilization regulon transcriptional repressor/proline dehydrogenase/delta 1-pyrroline-5-carboxylate dehydrogenase